MPARQSPIWKWFEDDPDDYSKVKCLVPGCKKPLISRGKSGTPKGKLSVAPLPEHLKRYHPDKYKSYEEDLRSKEEEVQKRKECKDESNELENESLASASNESKIKRVQTSLTMWTQGISLGTRPEGSTYKINDPRAKEKHRGVLSMMIMDIQPFSVVEDIGFRLLCQTMDPHFQLGSRHFYSDTLIKVYDSSMSKIEKKIKLDNPDTLNLQLDGWSADHHGYIGLIFNYITENWKRVNLVVGCTPFDKRHTGENLGIWTEEKLEKFNVLHKADRIVSDTAANMLKMMDHLPDSMDHVDCLNHVLNLVVKAEVLGRPEIDNLITIVKKVVSFANMSTNFYDDFEKNMSRKRSKKESINTGLSYKME